MNGHMGRGFGGRGVPAEKANVGDTTKKLLNHSGKTMIPAIVALVLAALSAIFTIIKKKLIHTRIRQIAKIPPSSSQIALNIKSFLTTGIFSGEP